MINVILTPSLYNSLFQTASFCSRHKNEDIEIVVPDKLSLFMERFLFEQLNISASFNIKVSTFNRFAKRNCPIDKEKQISKIGSVLKVHKILNENLENLKVLKNKAYSFTYAENILRTINQLKASKIEPEEMLDFKCNETQLQEKINDLALVYSKYEQEKAGLIDASDAFLMSVFSVAQGRENFKILFVGFDDFTAIEYSLIEQLAKNCDVYLFDYYGKGTNKYIFNGEVLDQLRNIAMTNGLPISVVECDDCLSKLKQFLHKNIYGFGKEKFLLTEESVQIYSGKNLTEEIGYVARDIRKKVLDGENYKNFGVAVFGLEGNECKVKEIFDKYEINYYLDSELNLSTSAFYKFIMSVLSFNLQGFAFENLIDIINSPFCTLELEQKQDLILKLQSVNYRGKITPELKLGIEDSVKDCLVDFFKYIQIEKNDTVKTFIDRIIQMDEFFNFEKILENLFNESDVRDRILLQKSREEVFNLFDEILKYNSELSFEEFADIFSHITSIIKVNNLPQHLDCVKVIDAEENMEIFDNLYVVNCVNSLAPSLKHDCGIIVDEEINKLNFSHKLNPTIAHINKLSRLRLYNLILLFNKNLCLTYSQNASDIIKELNNKLQLKNKNKIIDLPVLHSFNSNVYFALSKWDYINFVCKNKIEKIKNNLNINENILKNNKIYSISKENLNIFENLKTISASTLESYFKCPLFAFLGSILKIKPRIDNEIQSLDIGNMLHEIMFVYYKKNKLVGDVYEFCKNQVFKFVEKDDRLKLNVKSPILTNLIDEAVRVINGLNYIDENSLFQPKMFEHEFANNSALKLKNIDVIGKVDRVDVYNDMFRIVDYKSGKADANLKELYYGNKLQLFLYSCAIENEFNKKAVGAFYLPLHNDYSREVKNPYSLKGFYLAENFVADAMDKRINETLDSDIVNLKLTKSGSVGKGSTHKALSIDELNNLKNYSKLVSENAVNEIKSGYIQPTPSDVLKPCEYCPYLHICLKSSNSIEYRRSLDVNVDSFKEVKDE